jgi:hypothetical protein
MEHVDRLGEHVAVELAFDSIGFDQLTGTVDDARIELWVCEYVGAEEIDGDVTERLVAWEQVCAVEVAEDPVKVFLVWVSKCSLFRAMRRLTTCSFHTAQACSVALSTSTLPLPKLSLTFAVKLPPT